MWLYASLVIVVFKWYCTARISGEISNFDQNNAYIDGACFVQILQLVLHNQIFRSDENKNVHETFLF